MHCNCETLCVEYLGRYPKEFDDDDDAQSQYVRVKPDVIQKIKQCLESLTQKETYQKMVLSDSNSAPRDLKQVQNIKYASDKSSRKDQGNRENIADDVQALITQMGESPYIQEVLQIKGRPPCFILYLEDQINEMKRLSSSSNSFVIGVDRTFNLGPCYVTTLVYKNDTVVRKGTDTSPLFLGPVFLHRDADFQRYCKFFTHLKCKLKIDCNTETRVVFGSDEEKALTKALRECFPHAMHTLCTRHILENVGRYMEKRLVSINL